MGEDDPFRAIRQAIVEIKDLSLSALDELVKACMGAPSQSVAACLCEAVQDLERVLKLLREACTLLAADRPSGRQKQKITT